MLADAKMNAIYQMALGDSARFNQFLEHPEDFKNEFELTNDDITLIKNILNKTVTIKDVLRYMNPPLIPKPIPRPWEIYFNDKFMLH